MEQHKTLAGGAREQGMVGARRLTQYGIAVFHFSQPENPFVPCIEVGPDFSIAGLPVQLRECCGHTGSAMAQAVVRKAGRNG